MKSALSRLVALCWNEIPSVRLRWRALDTLELDEPGDADTPRAGEVPRSELDCLSCGACCRTGYDGRILIPPEDLARWRRIGRSDLARAIQPGHFGLSAFATREDGSCVHLGTATEPHACRIYEDRGTTCREFERGSAQCLEFRRDFAVAGAARDLSSRGDLKHD